MVEVLCFNRTLEVWKRYVFERQIQVGDCFNRTLEVWKHGVLFGLVLYLPRFQSNLRGMETYHARLTSSTLTSVSIEP